MTMRRFTILVVLAALALPASLADAGDKVVASDCTWKGKKLYGKIQFVEHFPDIKVKIVDHFPDLKVKQVEHFPDTCGLWKVVEHFPDLKVQIVEHFPDVKVKYVDHFPGLP